MGCTAPPESHSPLLSGTHEGAKGHGLQQGTHPSMTASLAWMGTELKPVKRQRVERGRNLGPLWRQPQSHVHIFVDLGKSEPAPGSLQVAVRPSSWALVTRA